jgi:DNA repair protein RecN (Recombination protein N)
MLLELHISGLGVIDDVTLELAPGLNVLTGETGAGKTMVTEGLTLALGRRARSGIVRQGATRARLEARFEAVPAVAEWAEDGELVLARALSADGRSSARAGGQLAPLSTLQELGAELVEVHGQHQTQRLLSPATQLSFMDRFAGPEHLETLRRYRERYERHRAVQVRLTELDRDAREREREKDLLAYQVGEIEAARLRPGERAELEAEERRLGNAERILDRMAEAQRMLLDEEAAADLLGVAAAALEEAAGLDPGAADLAARLRSLAEEARDAGEAARGYLDIVDLDPARLEEVRARIAAIRDLERKYGDGEGGILAYLEGARERLATLERSGDEREALEGEDAVLAEELRSVAARLSATRVEAAPRLASAMEDELRELGMPEATLEVRPVPRAPGPDGGESVEVLFSGGSGQAPRPVEKAASGGELSRTMLALRTVLADLDDVPTLVFDEVDQGIGGRAGVAVGRRLARVAALRQVLVVTHLPQIACFADRHFRVTKEGGRARVEALGERERVAELSRMLSGMPTEEAATHAEQLLAEAARERTR